MYQALIIDDENHVRKTIAILGLWAENHLNPSLQATDGKSALLLMEQQPIDLVLVDIKMPVMDGMEFLELATKRFPKTRYVIVSGFSDFEYAKKAIHFQIMDYLLKPISETELNRCLCHAVKELDKEREMEKENPMLDLISCICGSGTAESCCGIASIHITEPSTMCWDTHLIQTFTHYLETYRYLGAEYMIRIEKSHVLIMGILIPEYNPAHHSLSVVRQRLTHHLTQALSLLFKENRIITLAGIGALSFPAVTALKHSYQTASCLVSQLNLLTEVPLVTAEYELCDKYKPYSIASKKELLRRALEKGDIKYFQNVLESYFEILQKKSMVTERTLSHNYSELLLLLQDFAQSKCMESYYEIMPSLFDTEAFGNIRGVSAFIDYFCNLFLMLLKDTNSNRQLTVNSILQEIKTYIEENYAHDITLTFFSDRYHLTKEYLSKQFKEQYGHGIYEYVLLFRMHKAVELLLSSNMKIQEISDHVGYSDTNYFSKAFKTFYGLSPKEYRQQHQIL